MQNLFVRFGDHCLVVTRDNQQFDKLENCFVHLNIQDPLSLELSWSDGLFWTVMETPPLLVNQGPQTVEAGARFWVTYEAQKRFNPIHRGIMASVCILSVQFGGTLEGARSMFEQEHGHRIVCKLRLGIGPQACAMYLGRAQQISTDDKGIRTYSWIAGDDPQEEGGFLMLSPRKQEDWETHAREAKEMSSPRSEMTPVDSDQFVNKRRGLPVLIYDKNVQLQFFNLLNGKFVETGHVALGLKPQRRSLRTEKEVAAGVMNMRLTPQITAAIHFNKVGVTRIILEVLEYQKTLKTIGDGIPPKTF